MARRLSIMLVLLLLTLAAGGLASGHWRTPAAAAARTTQHGATPCLLPTFDEGYLQNPGVTAQVLCVNTGKAATPHDISAAHYAPQCQDGGPVACYHPCYAYTAGVPYPYHPVPCAGDLWGTPSRT